MFVRNRVGEIQRLTNPSNWRHVSSTDNPADLLSRGLNSNELINSKMWWHRPDFLRFTEDRRPSSDFIRLDGDMPEQRMLSAAVAAVERCAISDLLNKFSNLNKTCRIVAYCLRLLPKYRPVHSSALLRLKSAGGERKSSRI